MSDPRLREAAEAAAAEVTVAAVLVVAVAAVSSGRTATQRMGVSAIRMYPIRRAGSI